MAQEWLELGKALAAGVGIAVPLVGAMTYFHSDRKTTSNRRFDVLDTTTKRLDNDLTTLVRQLGAQGAEIEKRFMPRPEHDAAIERLDRNIVELTRAFATLNNHLFELARERREQR